MIEQARQTGSQFKTLPRVRVFQITRQPRVLRKPIPFQRGENPPDERVWSIGRGRWNFHDPTDLSPQPLRQIIEIDSRADSEAIRHCQFDAPPERAARNDYLRARKRSP